MKTAASDAHQTGMSVAAGLTYVFSPQGCFLTKSHVPTPSDKESMVRIGNHFYLKGRILAPIRTHGSCFSARAR